MIMLLHLSTKQVLLIMLKQMGKDGIEIAAALKYLSNFWGPLEMPLINCKVELSLKCIEH